MVERVALPLGGYQVPEVVSTREETLHCFACGGALSHSCGCESVRLHRDRLASLIYWVQRDTLDAVLAAIPSAVASDDVVEKAAEAMWQSESERASGRRRLIPWNEEGGDTQAKWRSLARAAIAAIPSAGGVEERLRSLVETGRDYVKDVADGFAWKLCAESAMQQAKDDLALFDAALNSASPESTSK
jgi:hypothetical protein